MTYEPVYFDHIEVHVTDIRRYSEFLIALFRGGRVREISESGTSMFNSPDGLNIEIKKTKDAGQGTHGFCLPCIRLSNARQHLDTLKVVIDRSITNSAGEVFFFRDHENVEWHAKSYLHRDEFINW